MADEFLNPYTFIPAFPRDGLPGRLQDRQPPPRDRLREDCWTGRIAVRLTVETPLLILDTPRGRPPDEGDDDHRVYSVRIRGGRPHLPATSVKGMLRAAYEAVTNSRFGVFGDHDAPLGFRRDVGYALTMVPVYIAGEGELYELKQALLEMYEKKSGEALYPRKDRPAPRHRERLRAVIKRGKTAEVVDRFIREDEPVEELRLQRGERAVSGIAYVTGRNVDGKRYERFFYRENSQPGRKPEPMPLARKWSQLAEDWGRLIRNYQDVHRREEQVGDGLDPLARSPHLHDRDWLTLQPRMVCYAHLDQNRRVDRLYPVLVPRDLYPVAPKDLLPGSLAPASSYDELSPADRVFGWVAPGGSGVRPAAYRGRLRIGPVVCEQDAAEAVERFDGDGLPLAILSAPKPQQGRFYLAESADRPDRPLPDGTPKEQLYRAGRGLRGRKAYWHHAGLDPARHWSEGEGQGDPTQVPVSRHYREFRRPRALYDDYSPAPGENRYPTTAAEQRDSQNRSIAGWVRRGTTFRFTIEVRDLDDVELGALVWLLTLPPGHFHRLGFGRPLGFGSVRLAIDSENSQLHTGGQYVDYYRSLSASLPSNAVRDVLDQAREEFERLVDSCPQLVTVREAVLAVARGNPDLPVHYPRVRPSWWRENRPAPPDPRGRNYEWFTANERMADTAIAPGRGRALPTPVNPSAHLPIYPDKDADKTRNAKGNKNRKTHGKPTRSSGSRSRSRRRGMG